MFLRTNFYNGRSEFAFNFHWGEAWVSSKILAADAVGRRTTGRILAFQILVANLMGAIISEEQYKMGCGVRLYKGKDAHAHGKRPVSPQDLDWAVDMGLRRGIMTVYPGNLWQGSTVLTPTMALIKYLPEGFGQEYQGFQRIADTGIVVPPGFTLSTLGEERARINAINDRLAKHAYTYRPDQGDKTITLDIGSLLMRRREAPTPDPRLGRFSSPIQQMSKVDRATIRIDGRQTVDVDMKGAHAHMVYCLEGIEKVGDPYAVPGLPVAMRPVIKHSTIVMLNCAGRSRFVENLRWNDRATTNLTPYQARETINLDFMGFSHEDVAVALGAFHAPIAHRLYTNMAGYLQSVEADIAGRVMEALAHLRVPAIGVHDSVIVPAEYNDLARSLMAKFYVEVLTRECGKSYGGWCASITSTFGV